MIGRFALAVAAALALPIAVLAAMVGQQEYLLANAPIVNVPLRGFDPRDLLRGHYIRAQFDWDWEHEATPSERDVPVSGGLCILSTEGAKPRVRFLKDWRFGDKVDANCRFVLAGYRWAGRDRQAARFSPTNLAGSGDSVKIFIPETRGQEFSDVLVKRPGALTVDLAVRPDGSASIKALRFDGKVFGR